MVSAVAAGGCIGGPQPLPPDQVISEVAGSGAAGAGGSDAGSGQSGVSGSGAAGSSAGASAAGGPAIDQLDGGALCVEGSLDGGVDGAADCLPTSDDDAGVTSM